MTRSSAAIIRAPRYNRTQFFSSKASPQLAFFYFVAGFSRSESNTGRVTGALSGDVCT